MSSGSSRLLLAFAWCSACALMIPLFTAGALVLDEHGSYWILDSDLPGSSLRRSLDYAAIPPLSAWLQWAFMEVLGRSELTFRLPSALCFLGAIGVIERAGRRLRNAECGAVAAVLLAWHPEAMDEVRIARCYGLVLLLASLLLLQSVDWQRSLKSYWRAGLWALTSVALLWTHYTTGLLIACCWAALLCSSDLHRRKTRDGLWQFLLAAGIVVLGTLPLLPAVMRLSEWSPFLNFSPATPSLLAGMGSFWWAGVPAAMAIRLFPWSGKGSSGNAADTAEGMSVSSQEATRPEKFTKFRGTRVGDGGVPWGELLLLLACSLLPTLLLVAVSAETMPSLSNPRYRTAFAPAAVCLLAVLLTSPTSHRRSPAIVAASALAALTVAWMLSPLYPWQTGRLGHTVDADWYQLNQHLAEHAMEGTPFLVQSGLVEAHLVPMFLEDKLFMEYVACRVSRFYISQRHPRYALPFIWQGHPKVTPHFRSLLSDWNAAAADFWVAAATDTDLNRQSLMWINGLAEETGFEVVESLQWPGAELLHFAVPGTIPLSGPGERGKSVLE